MSFLTDFGELLTQTATREALVSRDDFAQPTYGTGTTYRCRVVRKQTIVRSVQAARAEADSVVGEVLSNAQVWTEPVGWQTTDRITLDDGTQPQILDVARFPDENGPHHEVVYV